MSRERGFKLLAVAFLLMLPLVTPQIRGADEIEYFSYLRSAVIDRDLDFDNEYRHFYERDPEGLAGFHATFLERTEPRTGRRINLAPMGTALLWSPFYLSMHGGVLASRVVGASIEADGFGGPYLASVGYASALYGFLGLLLIYDGLIRWAGARAEHAVLAVLAIWFGTPVLYYMTLAPGFSHACSLFAVSLIVWLSARLAARPGARATEWLAVGVAVGVAGLIREQDALFGVVPAGIWLAHTIDRRRPREAVERALALGGTAILMFVPQLFAYRAINGSFGPSGLVARKMSYSSPHFLEVLFDPGHGLLIWSPLLLLAGIGLAIRLGRGATPLAWSLAIALLLQIWINGSVESWSQAGAFGSRRFVATSAVFAWGLTTLIEVATRHSGRAVVAASLALCVWWNLSLMVQFGLRLMSRQRLEWPEVAVNQVVEVPRHLGRATLLFFTDRERLVRESR